MSSPKPPTDREPLNVSNWYEKMEAAMLAYPGEWRKHFTRQELEIIERELRPEIMWAIQAETEDLPGPRRVAAFVDK